MPRSENIATRRDGTSKAVHAVNEELIALLHVRPAPPHMCNDALLVLACNLFQDRVAAFAAIVDHLACTGDADSDELRRQADRLRTEWQAIAQAVAMTRAAHPAGRRAKADVLHAYHQHVGGTEGIEIDLALSLVADLRAARGA